MKKILRIVFCLPLFSIFIPDGYAQSGIISTYIGHPLPVDGALATTQAVVSPGAIASDGTGGFYVVSLPKHQVYRVNSAGVISLVAGYGSLGFSGDGGPAIYAQVRPNGIAVDATGNLFIADGLNNRIRKVDTSGVITTVVGNGTSAFAGDGGPATAASLNDPTSVAVDAAGNLFIVDLGNRRVREVTGAGIISTVAGNGSTSFSGDGGQATLAGLDPNGVAVDGFGNLLISERFNSRIRKVIPVGTISTVAGTGTNGYNGDGIPANTAQINLPEGVAVDAGGIVYIADHGNSRVRKVALDGTISTIAGSGTPGFSGDGALATLASLKGPNAIAVDGAGNLYIADGDGLFLADGSNNRVRLVTTDGLINTVAGDGTTGSIGDGGPAVQASLANPSGVTVDGAGNLFIADLSNYRIRKVTPGGGISTVAGSGLIGYNGDGILATAAALNFAAATAVDGAGNLYIADLGNARVRKVTPGGVISTVAGNGTTGFGGDGGQAIFAALNQPSGVAVDGSGNLFIADFGNHRVRKVTPAGVISTVTAAATGPSGLAFDGSGNLYIADSTNSRIRKLTPGGVTSTVVAGSFSSGFSGDGGPATSATLSGPVGIAVDADGNLFIADRNNNRIRKVTPDGIINTIAGNGINAFSGDGGLATSASLAVPIAVAVDVAGNLYIADMADSRIRKVELEPDTVLSTSTILRADFNGDGKSDILLQNADGSSSIWLMDGLSVTSIGGLIGPGTGWRVVEVADFNGDGKSDIVWQHTNGSASIWLMNGLNMSSGGGLIDPGTGWWIKRIGDFNGDGKSDIVWQHTDGSTSIWLMNGLNMSSGGGLIGPATGWSVRNSGDFNGDGKSDIVWQNIDGSAAIWLMNGLSMIGGGGLIGPATGWSVRNSEDFNGDGKSDIVWQNTDGRSSVWLMDGPSLIDGGGLLGAGTGWRTAP